MKNLLMTLVAVLAVAGQANAQSGAATAVEAARAGQAAAVGASAVGAGAKAAVNVSAGLSAVGGATGKSVNAATGKSTTSSVTPGICSRTILGSTDVRGAVEVNVINSASACASKYDTATLNVAAVIGNAMAGVLKGTDYNKADKALKMSADQAGVKALASIQGISLSEAKSKFKEVIKECDMFNKNIAQLN